MHTSHERSLVVLHVVMTVVVIVFVELDLHR